jgi:hypothetical protein
MLQWVVSTSPTLQVGRQPFVGCPHLLIQYTGNYPVYLDAVPPSAAWERAKSPLTKTAAHISFKVPWHRPLTVLPICHCSQQCHHCACLLVVTKCIEREVNTVRSSLNEATGGGPTDGRTAAFEPSLSLSTVVIPSAMLWHIQSWPKTCGRPGQVNDLAPH